MFDIKEELEKMQGKLVRREKKDFTIGKSNPTPWQTLKEQAYLALKSGFLPSSIKTPEQAVIIALKGRELGIPVMQAMSQINVINGKPSLSAELIMGLIYKGCPTAEITILSRTSTECKIEARRKSTDKYFTFEFTFDDAKKMGLTGKDNWIKQPKTMLHWRVVSMMGREMFPDCVMGASYVPEELADNVDIEYEDGSIETTAVVTNPTPTYEIPKILQTGVSAEEKKPSGEVKAQADNKVHQNRTSVPLTETQKKTYAITLYKLASTLGFDEECWKPYIYGKYKVEHTKDLTEIQFQTEIQRLRACMTAKDGDVLAKEKLQALEFEVSIYDPKRKEPAEEAEENVSKSKEQGKLI